MSSNTGTDQTEELLHAYRVPDGYADEISDRPGTAPRDGLSAPPTPVG